MFCFSAAQAPRPKRTGEPLASAFDQSDVYVGPKKGAGRHDTQTLAEN
jgi:hypothetical protein